MTISEVISSVYLYDLEISYNNGEVLEIADNISSISLSATLMWPNCLIKWPNDKHHGLEFEAFAALVQISGKAMPHDSISHS